MPCCEFFNLDILLFDLSLQTVILLFGYRYRSAPVHALVSLRRWSRGTSVDIAVLARTSNKTFTEVGFLDRIHIV